MFHQKEEENIQIRNLLRLILKILFIAGGAFDGIEKLISKRLNLNVIGYKSIKVDAISNQNILQFINPKRFEEIWINT